MAGSYERINYQLRPAKAVERKMMAEAFRHLSPFGAVPHYRYVGFGSAYFSDFLLFHRNLGISNMVSIERDADKAERFEFNKPFKCVQLEFAEASEVLGRLQWNDLRTIAWLDYDGKLERSVLSDIKQVCAKAITGSVLVVTVNASPSPEDPDGDRLKKLRERVGEERVPAELKNADLDGWGTAATCRRIVENEVKLALSDRNGLLPEGHHYRFQQIFNFNYADGQKMLTVGWLLYDEGQHNLVGQCNFAGIHFCRAERDPYLIEIPMLTPKERRFLDAQLPHSEKDGALQIPPAVPAKDGEQYSRLYRYFPHYADVEL